MKIHYFSAEAWEETYVKEKLPDSEVVCHAGSLASAPTLSDEKADVLSIFIDSKIGEEEMARFPTLKLIATRSTGFDHIDLAAAKARGIAVANVPFYGENTVAEFTFALILALSRKVIDADESVREKGMFAQQGLRGFDLRGKTIGVVGTGHIGAHVIRMAKGFEMEVLAFDVQQNAALSAQYAFAYVTLDELLAKSDIVSLHVPYNQHTHHLLNAENLAVMKPGAYLVNTARGALVDTAALVSALKEERLAGAALDVLEEEGDLAEEDVLLASPHPNEAALRMLLANHYLIKHPRVIVTPHIAFNTDEAVRRIVDTTIENIQGFTSGAPVNIVPA